MSPADSAAAQRLRVLGLSNGDHRRSMSGVPGYLFDGLDRTFAQVERVDYSVDGARRLALAVATAAPRRAKWVGRFHAGRLASRAQSASLRGAIPGQSDFDVAVQVHGWIVGQPRPFTVFADQTRLMADRGWPSWIPMPPRDREWLLATEQAMYEAAAHIFAMGQSTKKSLAADYGLHPARVTVVGGGLNYAALPELRSLPNDRSVLFVGRDFERKGGEVLLRAFRRAREKVPGAVLHIAGPRHRISAPGVIAHGPVDRTQLAALFRRARVFCMPSLYEPYGLAFAEAMAYGIPCIGSTAQSIPEILGYGQAGLLPPSGAEVALADALVELLRDDQLAVSLGKAGRMRVELVHRWEHVAERMKAGLFAVVRPHYSGSDGTRSQNEQRQAIE